MTRDKEPAIYCRGACGEAKSRDRAAKQPLWTPWRR